MSGSQRETIVLSGGGTGGHVTPLVAVGHELKRLSPDIKLVYIGSGSELENRITAELGIQQIAIRVGKFRRYHGQGLLAHALDLKTIFFNVRDFFLFCIGLGQSLYYLAALRPATVFSKGGYVALPVGLAAVFWRRRLVIHDSDPHPGLANRTLARWADAIATGFPPEYYPYDKKQLHYTGNMVSDRYRSTSKTEARMRLGLETIDRPVVMVTGGGGGAQMLNDAVLDVLDELSALYHIIHLCGSRDYSRVKRRLPELTYQKEHYQLFDFVDNEMPDLLAAADLVISRAGANSIAEFAALGQVCLIVPGAHLTGGHQLKNAAILADAKAAVVMQETELAERERFVEQVRILLADKKN